MLKLDSNLYEVKTQPASFKNGCSSQLSFGIYPLDYVLKPFLYTLLTR